MPETTFHVRSQWRTWHAPATVAMVALGVGATFGAWRDILSTAIGDPEASHVLLVPVVFAWLVWVRRQRLRLARPTGQWIGPLLIALGGVISIYGYTHTYGALWHGGSVLVVMGCALSVLGLDVLIKLLPAFIVLVFLVPMPLRLRLAIGLPLQEVSAAATHWVFQLLGETTQRSGNMISINGEPVTIIEACNGMRMVFTLVMVSYAYAFGTPLHGYVRTLIILASPILAIACNVVRLVPTIWMYGYASHEIAGHFHDWAGWAMVGVAFLLLMGILQLLRWLLIPVAPFTLAAD